MKLKTVQIKTVQIKNFRSIKYIELNWDPGCLVLVGINESGKTNILRAISMLSDEHDPTVDDEREVMPNEDPVEESFIRFVFPFGADVYKELDDHVSAEVGAATFRKLVTKSGGKNITLRDACRMHKEGLYRVNILTQNKDYSYWSMPSKYKGYNVINKWKKPSPSWPAAFTVEKSKYPEETASIKSKLIHLDDFEPEAIPDAYLADVDFKYIWGVIGANVANVVMENHPDCRVWQYSDDNLLPGSIPIASFTADPDYCLPLRHMFELSGFKGAASIQKALEKAAEKKKWYEQSS